LNSETIKQTRISKRKNQLRDKVIIFTILFTIILFTGFSILIFKRVSLVWDIDGVGQYYPSFIYIGKYLQRFFLGIFNGEWNLPLFDLRIGMGEDIIGALNYYGFGDPLNLLAIFVTKDNSAWLFSAMIVLRMWLSGVALIAYFNHFKLSFFASVLPALCYSYSGFVLYGGLRYSEWLSVLIYLPLILLGIEKILEGKRINLLVFSVCYGALCGFYFLFLISLILIIYVPVRLYFSNSQFVFKLQILLKSISAFFLGILLSAPFFFTAIQAYLNSERNSTPITNVIFNVSNYKPLSILSVSTISSVNPYLNGIIFFEFISLFLIFFIPNSKRKFQCIIFLITTLIAMLLPITGYIFNAFGQSNTRWYLIIHLLCCGIFSVVLDTFLRKNIILSDRRKMIIAKSAVLVITVFNVVGNTVYAFTPKGTFYRTNEETNKFGSDFIKYKKACKYVDSPFVYADVDKTNTIQPYRVSNSLLTNINGRPENVAMINDYNGLTYWLSIINKETQRNVNDYNNSLLYWRSYGFGENVAYNTFAGVKYYLTKSSIEDPNYNLIEVVNFNKEKWLVYENKMWQGLSFSMKKNEWKKINNQKISTYDKVEDAFLIKDKNKIETKYSNDKIIVNLDNAEGDTIITAIPFNKNWKAYIDKKPALIKKEIMNFLSVDVKRNQKKIVFKYSNRITKIGIFCSLFSMLILVLSDNKKIFYNKKNMFQLKMTSHSFKKK